MPSRQRAATHQQQLQLAARLGRPQLLHVVDHQPEPVLQPHQVRQQPLGDRPPVQVRRRRQLPHQSRPRGRLAQPPSSDIQNRCGSPSCRPTGNAALSARPASPAHNRSKTVFPLSGGADTTVTRADASSRLNSPGGHDSFCPRASDRPATAADARSGPMARSSHNASWHPQPACGPVDLRCHRQEILELVGFEHTAQRLGGLGPAPPTAGRVACEQSAVNRRSKIWQRVTSVLLMLPVAQRLAPLAALSRSGSPVRRAIVTAAWQERPARVTGRGASARARRGRVPGRVPTIRAGRG